ncbi:MAG: type II toxin-antitoxin system RelE/ParE family toxin [Aestuariivirga sp.]
MGRITLTPRAEQDLEDIWNTIAADNSRAADNLIRRIFRKAELASDQPGMGAPRPELSATARILIEGRYLVIYEPLVDGIKIVTVVHGMRDPESWLV